MILWLQAATILIIVAVPVLAARQWQRRSPLIYFVFGALTFIGAQLIHLPLNWLLGELGLITQDGLGNGNLVRTALVLGLSAGLTEELARVVGYSLLKKTRGFDDGVMFGLGHGGFEAMLFGGVFGAASVSALYWAQSGAGPAAGLSAAQLQGLQELLAQASAKPGLVVLPLVERVIALAAQISLSVMVLRSFQTGKPMYVVAAIAYHALIDALAVMAVQRLDSLFLAEGLLAISVVPLVLWAWRQRGPSPAARPHNLGQAAALRSMLVKELRFQWRTRRLLIVGAVFIVFGMSAPLLTRFTPEILRSVEGAAEFADLIPKPTAADAAAEYVSSITQFGFVVVILLGMGAVAGEKEKGTAAMLVSKPLPRWMFVLSKFAAQSLVYLLAFLVAGLGSYYYILVLFEAPDASAYLLANVLLYLWILVFAAVTLLGSTVARTTGAAAGIALAGSIGLLLLGTVPRYGALAPGGLVSWSGALAAGTASPPNGGGLVGSLVLILLLLLASVASIEQQEL